MKSSWLIWGVVALVVLAGGYFLLSQNKGAPQIPEQTVPIPEATNEASPSTVEGGMVELKLDASNYKFSTNELKVRKGDRVKITLTSTGGTHDLKIDQFNVATKVVDTGMSDSVEFTADKVGSFEYYCSVGNHKAMGMKGILVVE